MRHPLPGHFHRQKAFIPLAIIASILALPSLPASQEAARAPIAHDQNTEQAPAAPRERISAEIASALDSGGPVQVIIYLDLPDPPASPARRKLEIARAQDNVLRGLTDKDFTMRWRYGMIPAWPAISTRPGLAKLSSLPGVCASISILRPT